MQHAVGTRPRSRARVMWLAEERRARCANMAPPTWHLQHGTVGGAASRARACQAPMASPAARECHRRPRRRRARGAGPAGAGLCAATPRAPRGAAARQGGAFRREGFRGAWAGRRAKRAPRPGAAPPVRTQAGPPPLRRPQPATPVAAPPRRRRAAASPASARRPPRFTPCRSAGALPCYPWRLQGRAVDMHAVMTRTSVHAACTWAPPPPPRRISGRGEGAEGAKQLRRPGVRLRDGARGDWQGARGVKKRGARYRLRTRSGPAAGGAAGRPVRAVRGEGPRPKGVPFLG
jgi:hypothetical protein